MTIAEKSAALSTALSKSIDLAEEYYQNCNLEKCESPIGTFKCIESKGTIPETADHGEYGAFNIYYDSDVDDTTITSTSTDADIKASIKNKVNSMEWVDAKVSETKIQLTKI